MSYRPRIPVAASYAAAIGRATYNFAYLEWQIVSICEKLKPGFVYTIGKNTAGWLARRFQSIIANATPADPSARARLEALAVSFHSLVARRNMLVHGHPFTAHGGEQRLGYAGNGSFVEWTESNILSAAMEFETAAIEGNAIYYKHLN